MYTTFCIFSAAALALCKLAAGQAAGVGAATIGTMEGTFTVPFDAWDGTSPPECTSVMAGCTGEFVTLKEATAGTITVLDDCTYKISQYSFSGEGPAVEWWADAQAGSPAVFPYSANAIKIAELGAPGSYQKGMNHGGAAEVVVRLGLAEDGTQLLLSPELDHISLWCEDFIVDFGNAALSCSGSEPLAIEPEAAAPLAEPTPAGPNGAAAPEAEAEAKPQAEGAAKPEAEAEAKAPAEAEAKPEGADEWAAEPEAEGAAKPEAEAKPEGAATPAVAPITAPALEPEAGTAPEVVEPTAPTDDGTLEPTAPTDDGAAVDSPPETAEGIEASGAAGVAGLASAGALAAAILLL